MKTMRIDTLPALSWLVAGTGADVTLFCGPAVECGDDYFVEGCWDGEFSGLGFADAANFFGSGGYVSAKSVVFASATHPLDCLFIARMGATTCVSNSFPFTVEFTGIELPKSVAYGARFATLARGLDRYRRALVRGGGVSIEQVACCNVRLSGASVDIVPKVSPGQFRGFEEYVSHLREVLAGTLGNAAAPKRQRPYASVVTCSSGYDSSACAALAREVGCEKAVTLRQAQRGDDDSGAPVCRALGLRVREFDRPDTGAYPTFSEAEFIATGMGGGEYYFSFFEDAIAGRAMITGFHGDVAWAVDAEPSAALKRVSTAGGCLTEFRLRANSFHIPLPYVAFANYRRLREIGEAGDMRRYRVAGPYDRPIPRRIVVERGVPPDVFGLRKQAASSLFFHHTYPLGEKSLEDFLSYEAREFRTFGFWLRRFLWRLRYKIYWFLAGGRVADALLPRRLSRTIRGIVAGGDPVSFERSDPRLGGALILWAIEKVRPRYRDVPRG